MFNSLVQRPLLIIIILNLLIQNINGLRDSLNFILKAGTRECFYDELNTSDDLVRYIDTFVEVGALVDVSLRIYGPLSREEIQTESFEAALVDEEIALNLIKSNSISNQVAGSSSSSGGGGSGSGGNSGENEEGIKDSTTTLSYSYEFVANTIGTYAFCLDNRCVYIYML